jgi:5-methylcytosine-specific restriction endonuclease McrA
MFKITGEKYIYVLGIDGTPQMPTKRHRRVKRLLDTGLARIVEHKPFTIQLKYENDATVQPVVLGIDPGRTNIGLAAVTGSGELLMSAVVKTRNKEIRKLMDERRAHRRASRMGERKARQRLAKRYNTMVKSGMVMRHLPQYGEDGTITCKYIRNTEARFCNRKRPDGWLTPTVRHLVQTHVNAVKRMAKYLPVSDVALEVNKFAFMLMDNPETSGIDFQNGVLKGYSDVNEAVYAMQDGKCLLCGKGIEQYHHIVPKYKGGSNSLKNIAGLCNCCHEKIHTDEAVQIKLLKLKDGMLKKYHALSALNQAVPYIYRELYGLMDGHVAVVGGYETKHMRASLGFEKSEDNQMHEADACCIAYAAYGIEPAEKPVFTDTYTIKQFRGHNRAIINNQRERTYKLDGKVVAKNRKPRFEQTGVPTLSQWFDKQAELSGIETAEKLRSRLTVTKSTRYYNTDGRVLPGTEYMYRGVRYVLGGQQNNGHYFYPYEDRNARMRASECLVLRRGGLVFI